MVKCNILGAASIEIPEHAEKEQIICCLNVCTYPEVECYTSAAVLCCDLNIS